jgi:hypothetical protein
MMKSVKSNSRQNIFKTQLCAMVVVQMMIDFGGENRAIGKSGNLRGDRR